MRSLTGAAFVSLDGVIQGPGGSSEDRTGGFAQPYALLLGRRIWDIVAAYGPYAEGDAPDAQAKAGA